ncbi:MarR family winged helix-turn-helix transcriptional regulator [Candidatus Velamenicoccus archaeovorus]|uniref:MarR family winged helix-turn-helix transcriptional regulator n=1 Tax=Velamenicoccus archaeovorus TaxID=1930593 RepID=UPI0013E8E8AB|nr:MarR family transcriptional regulator [Candidatus Velamenicoccus archaeovorus]
MPYDVRLSELLQRVMRDFRVQAYRYSLSQKLPLSECRVLFLLCSGLPVKMNKIKQDLFVSGACVTSIADRLIRKKLIIRRRSDTDRRKVSLVLTDKGRSCLVRLEARRKGLLKAIFGNLTERDKKTIEDGVSILAVSLESVK